MPVERSKKYKERIDLARRIELSGIEMSPCSFCERNDHKCLVAENSNRCSECARRGRKCDVSGPSSSDWAAVEREEARLAAEREATLAKLLRLDKQQSFLRKRAGEMLRRGLKTLDELDEAEEKEKKDREEAEQREREAQVAAPSFADVSGDPFPDPFEGYSGVAFGADLHLSPSSWDVSEFVGGTASKDPGS